MYGQGYTIGQLARLAGVGVETVRFYERRGLIERPPRPRQGYRRYPAEALERIRFIRRAQGLGFSLREIAELLALRTDPEADCGGVLKRAQAKLEDVNEKIARLHEIRAALEVLVAACPGTGALEGCSILGALPGDGAAACEARITLSVTGIACQRCATRLRRILEADPATRSVTMDPARCRVTVTVSRAEGAEARLQARIRAAGFDAAPSAPTEAERP